MTKTAPRTTHDGAISPRTAGRPRSDAARRAVLDAAYAILVEGGLGSFSVEAVALRSRVARTTIYRSWPTKGLLAFDSFREAFEATLSFERTDRSDRDFQALIRSLARQLSGPAGCLAASVMAQAQTDHGLREHFLRDFSTPLRRRSGALLQAGIESGMFRAELDIPRILDAAVGAVYLRLLLGLSLDDEWADALARTLLHGCFSQPEGDIQTSFPERSIA